MHRKKILTIILIIFFAYILFGIILLILQRSLLYPADKTPFNNCEDFKSAEKINDNFRAYFVKRSTEKVAIYYHGNGGRACDRYYMEKYFEPLGYSVLYVEYPGYSEEGETSMGAILNQVTYVNDFINKKSFKDVIVLGESVGTGPAAYHASLPSNKISKIILFTPYDNMANVASFHYRWYPMSIMVRDNFKPDQWLASTTVPTVIILAENDEVVGLDQGKKLAEVVPSKNKIVYVVKGAGHNTIYSTQEFSSILYSELQND